VVGALDTFMFIRHLKNDGSKGEMAFHAVRGLMSFASLAVPALSLGVVALTVGKIGFDLYRGSEAGKKLDASLGALATNLRDMLSDQAKAPAAG